MVKCILRMLNFNHVLFVGTNNLLAYSCPDILPFLLSEIVYLV